MDSPKPSDPIINIYGNKVALGPYSSELIPLFQRWLNDFNVTRNLSQALKPLTREAEEKWYEKTIKSERDVLFVIYDRATMHPIGGCGLHDCDQFHRTAEFGIFIGNTEYWGKGYGTETTHLVLEYGFTALGLHNIMLRVFSFNERAIRTYLRIGFREIGRRREAHQLYGKAYDVIYMDCLATEFQTSIPNEI